jgi:cytochrome P450
MPSPIDTVTLPEPYSYYAQLPALYFDDALHCWVASSAEVVSAVLAEPECRVRPATEPVPPGIVGTAAGEVFGDLVRMTDGEQHDRRKAVIADVLAGVDSATAAQLAAMRTRQIISDSADPADPARAAMFAVPAAVIAELCGLDADSANSAATLIGEFVQCLPASATTLEQAAATRAAIELRALLGRYFKPGGTGLLADLARAATDDDAGPLLSNGIGLLSQAYDATAGLIGNTLYAMRREGVPPAAERVAFVREVARHDSPVHNTRRFAARTITLHGKDIREGQAILVLLAAANRDPAVNPDPDVFRPDRVDPVLFTFGAARHACPGELLAVGITDAVVGELVAGGYDPAELPAVPSYLPSANLRIPVLGWSAEVTR